MRLGIQSKWAGLSALAVGSALVLAAATSIRLVSSEMQESARRQTEAAAAQLAEFGSEAAVQQDNLTLQKAADILRQQPGIRYAAVFDIEGTVLASSPSGFLIEKNLPDLLSDDDLVAARALASDEPKLIHSRKPIRIRFADGKEQTIAWVRVGYSTAEADERIRAFVFQLLGVSAIGLVVGMALCLALARTFAKPVLRLEALAQRVAKGDFEISSNPKDTNRDDEIGDLAKAFNAMTGFLKKGKFLRHAFDRYVSAELADRIYQDPVASTAGAGQRREVTILFLDIRGFTKLSEKMSAEDVVKFLVNFFNRVSEPVFAGEGAIDKFIGDAMLAVFGFPVEHHDDPYRAVVAALRIQEIVAAYNRERFSWGLEPVGVGIGINTGMVVAGNVGCERKLDYTVVGDAVNVASRLCSLAKADQVLISDSTHERVRRRINAESLGEQQVKGREAPVEIFKVQSIAKDEGGAANVTQTR